MKMIRYIFGIFLFISAFSSCQDELSVDLSDRKFVRISKHSVYLNVGEKMILHASTDSLGSDAKTYNWSVLDAHVASIETRDNSSAIITGISEGSTVIKIESADGELKYFTDLSVSGERVIKVLSIGNRVAEDATENYLYDLAKAGGYKVMITNMFLEGSSLQHHWANASSRNPVYQLRAINTDGSRSTVNDVNLVSAIMGENWDYISFQEASHLAGMKEGYQEYLPQLVELTKSLATNPDLKMALHQTWAYSQDATQEEFAHYDRDQIQMYEAILDAVGESASLSGIDIVIPSGTAIQNGRTTYLGDRNYLGDLFTRDGLLLSYERGRFTAASTWYEALFGEDVTKNPYSLLALSEYENSLIKEAAHAAIAESNAVTTLTAFRYPEGFELNNYLLTAPVYVDFGAAVSPFPFNNYRFPTDPKLVNLIDQTGESTYFEIGVKDRFSGTLDRGLENNSGFPRTASQDMFFSDGNNPDFAVSSFALSNFNKDQKYTFVFYGHINDSGTETEFRVIGKNEGVAYLVNDHNWDNVAVVTDISPTDYGTLIIRLTKGPNNRHWAGFFGINAMIIMPEGYTLPGL